VRASNAIVAALVLALATPLLAHHSIASVYDKDKRTTLSAVVKQWRFVNPHPSIVVEVTTPNAPARTWTLEMDNRWELAELGFTENTLKPGDRLEVTGDLSGSRRTGSATIITPRKARRPPVLLPGPRMLRPGTGLRSVPAAHRACRS
jgi:hypothetical protein